MEEARFFKIAFGKSVNRQKNLFLGRSVSVLTWKGRGGTKQKNRAFLGVL